MPRLPERVGEPAPLSYERALRRALAPMLAQVRATLPKIRTAADARALGPALRRAWPDSKLRKIVADIGATAEARASRPWRSLRRKAGLDARGKPRRKPYDGDALLERWSREAAAKIGSVRDEVAEGMRQDVVAARELGIGHEELAAGWRRQGIPVKRGTLEGRTKVIAQNQLASLHAEVHRSNARALGATDFIWRTQKDSRVRDLHEKLEGTRHAYDSPPSEGLPGQPINCRCWAETVIDVELLSEFAPTIERGT